MTSKAMSSKQYFQSGGSHPYEHRLRLRPTAPSAYSRNTALERSLTVTNFQIPTRATFEMERPVTHNSPRLVVINTSFRSSFERKTARKRIPTFPELATDSTLKRKTNVSRLTNSSSTGRMQSGNSTFRRDIGSAANRLNLSVIGKDRENSAQSAGRPGSRNYLTQRQSNTFAAYAKYNDIVNATKAKEKEIDSPITSTRNDLSALVPEKLPPPPDLLSNEKHLWISDWVASTSAALRLDDTGTSARQSPKTLSVIQEQ